MIILKIKSIFFISKKGIEKEFNPSIFLSINEIIFEKRLNLNIIENIQNHIEKMNLYKSRYFSDLYSALAPSNYTQSNYIFELKKMVEELEKYGVQNYIEKIFYQNSKPEKISIKEYFNCKEMEKPKSLILLSDIFNERLNDFKKSMDDFLKEIEKNQLTFFDFLKEKNQNVAPGDKNLSDQEIIDRINQMKKIIKNINLLYSCNSLFFMEFLNVRKTIGKYILKGSLGNNYDQIISEDKIDGKQNKYFNIVCEKFRKIPDIAYDYSDSDIVNSKIILDSQRHFGEILIQFKENSLKYESYLNWSRNDCACGIQAFHPDFKASMKLYNWLLYNEEWIERRLTKDHLFLFQQIQHDFKIPFDITQFCTINNFSIPFPIVKEKLKKSYGFDINFYISFFLADEYHKIIESDRLNHTSGNHTLSFLYGFYRNTYLFSENRIYFGLNQPQTPNGDTKLWKNRKDSLYLIKPNNIEYIYKDPEHHFTIKNQSKSSFYIVKDKVDLINITNLVYNGKQEIKI